MGRLSRKMAIPKKKQILNVADRYMDIFYRQAVVPAQLCLLGIVKVTLC